MSQDELYELIEDVMSQNVVTISYFNIYITDEHVAFLPLDSGVLQAVAKLGGIITAVSAVVMGDRDRKRLIAQLRGMRLTDIFSLPEIIGVTHNEVQISYGITKATVHVAGKALRIKKSIGKKLESLLAV